MQRYQVAIIGAGPGGLSAAARAAEGGMSHILLESSPQLAQTIFRYQKGKHVMAEPSLLPLRSPMPFEAGTRENILSDWQKKLVALRINIRLNASVTAISGQKGQFVITLQNGDSVAAEHIVLAIGVQGKPRRLDVPGEDDGLVEFTLDDPEAFQGKHIVVVGAGDAAIENAIALAKQNKVYLINRRDEFARVKEGNLRLITRAIEKVELQCFFNTRVSCLRGKEAGDGRAGAIVLNTANGEVTVPCDLVIARLGAVPPRDLIEKFGVQFPSSDPAAVPSLSRTYESNVPGLYIIGALAGYPLIKQAMNQGYDVIEYIAGRALLPVDHELLRDKLKCLPWKDDVDEALRKLQERIPVLAKINALQFRELMLESELMAPKPGAVIFTRNDYTDTFFCVVYGFANVEVGPEKFFTLSPGQFFGEMSLLSGRRRSATVRAAEECILLEIPRRTMNRLIQSNESVRKFIDSVFIARAIQSHFAPEASLHELQEVLGNAKLERFRAGEILFKEGDTGDRLHLVRSGSLTVSRMVGGREIILSYVPAGNYVGEMGLLGNTKRMATVKAAVATETVSINSAGFQQLLERNSALKSQVQTKVQERLQDNAKMESTPDGGDVLDFLMKQGLGEATDVLLIDESLCVRCDNCERACADTHDGTSRLNREAGPTYATVHVPTSCRHCENPQCMKECPPDAIHRAPNGEVFIADNCIGCGNCQRNCPYGVIQMASIEPYRKRFWRKLLLGYEQQAHHHNEQQKKAVKCDMCGQLNGGPACVRACPTGAAIRVAPSKFVDLVASLRATGVR